MIAVSSKGQRFHALATYLVAGKRGAAHDRALWTSARNLPTADPQLAATIMQATATQSARVKKPVYHLVLSFDPTDTVNRSTMETIADRVLHRLGLQEHETILVAHGDHAHPHLHLMVNRVHPTAGIAWDLSHDFRQIQQVLRTVEREFGLREVPGRLARLPDRTSPFDIPDRPPVTSGELRQQARSGEVPFVERVRALAPEIRAATSWSDLETRLARHNLTLKARGQGLVVTDGTHMVKASRVGRDLSRRGLEGRFGIAYAARHQADAASRTPTAADGAPSTAAPPPTIASVTRDLRRYVYAKSLVAQEYEVTRGAAAADRALDHARWQASGKHSSTIAPALPIPVLASRVTRAHRATRQMHASRSGLADLRDLRRAVEEGLRHLLPPELRLLYRLLTAAERTLAQTLRRQLIDRVLGKDDAEIER